MNFVKRIGPGIVALGLCGGAVAHSISGDDWYDAGIAGNSSTITISPTVTSGGASLVLPEGISLDGITSLSFSAGTEFSSYDVLSRANGPTDQPQYAADEWLWGSSNTGSSGEEAVSLTATDVNGNPTFSDAPELTVSVGYGDANCIPPANAPPTFCGNYAGEIASVSVNGNTYTAKNPTQLVTGTGDLVFVNGVLKAGTGVGWTLTSTTQAPEIDSASAGGGLTLLLGSLMVIRGRRTGLFNRSSFASIG